MKLVSLPCEWKPLDLWFLGDFQWAGAKQRGTALEPLKQTIADALAAEAQGRTVRFVGLGDYTDFMSPSNRARLKSANLYDTATDVIDNKALELTEDIYEQALKPTVGKWVGLVEGHHLHELKDGTTTDMRLCEMLKARFLGTTGVIRLNFAVPGHRKRPSGGGISAVVWVHHGVGNGMTGYYPLTRLEKEAARWEGVDVFAIGHTTKKAAEWANKVYPRWWGGNRESDLTHRKVILLGTGGYSKTYIENSMQGRIPRGGYAEQKMLGAAIVGSPVVHIRPRILEGHYSLDITAEG